MPSPATAINVGSQSRPDACSGLISSRERKRAQLLVDEGAQRFLARQRRELFGIQPV
jgi:hypothetical protein